MTRDGKEPAVGTGRPHVKAVRLTDRQQQALTRLRGPRTESDFLRAVLAPVLDGDADVPLSADAAAVVAHLNRLAAVLLAWHGDIEVADAERIVSALLDGDPAGGSAPP